MADWIGRRFAVVVIAAFVFPSASLMGLVGTYGALMFNLMIADAGKGYKLMIVTSEAFAASSYDFSTSFSKDIIKHQHPLRLYFQLYLRPIADCLFYLSRCIMPDIDATHAVHPKKGSTDDSSSSTANGNFCRLAGSCSFELVC
ncbi:hypothetical protein PVAP13_9NG301873 [Panicum virgatum]|uniref:Uncharacterized protein n=1 Tax=Panicum virgatum TaxID=38727 RepID=A0A8T0MJM2_PANVG|nr:hypothetical protein PVAP13_9NG301873 [Panicum virgatum]